MSSSSLPIFSSLPQRPPTPPKDKTSQDLDDALRFLEEGHQSPRKERRSSDPDTATPQTGSSTGRPQPSSGAGKRVDFSPYPIYHNVPQAGQSDSSGSNRAKQSPLSREHKPLKSILKAANEPSPLTPDDIESKISYFTPEEPASFERMLQSIMQQLASQHRNARLDAYLALNSSLKAHEGLPDPQAMVDKMSLLMQFLARDIAWKDAEGILDTNIVTQALQLTCAIIYNPRTAQALDDDFRTFLIDRSTSMLEQTNVAKGVVKTHLFLLSQQRFHAGVMSHGRIERLLMALKTIDSRCSGNSAVAARLIIYQRLVEKSASTMLNKMHDWIENVLHGLLSNNKEIRIRAIEACSQAAYVLGTHPQASKTLLEVLDVVVEETQTFGDFFNSRLLNMITDQAVGPDVPRIWASLILFFRCKRRPIYKWPKFRDWLMTIQRCFNSGELTIKHQATVAWNKLVFTVMPDGTTTDTCRSMLKVPIATSIEKPGQDKQSQQVRQFALDSYYNLLHYALRPGLSHEELDTAWDAYVHPILLTILKASSKGPEQVCRVLCGLLNKSNGAWNINAALETEAIKPEELPRLDIRWVRSRLRRITTVFEPVLISAIRSSTFIAQANDAWTLLWQAIAEAGSQEVRTSKELKDAIAQVMNLFRRIWQKGPGTLQEADAGFWFQKFHNSVKSTVECLGPGPFVEKILSRTAEDEVEVAPTPSHRTAHAHSDAHSPFTFLLALYCQPPSGIKIDGPFLESASWLLRFLVTARNSDTEKLSMLSQALQSHPRLGSADVSTDISQHLWMEIAELATDLVSALKSTPAHEIENNRTGIRYAHDILKQFFQLSAIKDKLTGVALTLITAMCDATRTFGGEEAVVWTVIEPLSRALTESMDAIPIHAVSSITSRLLQQAVWPKDRREIGDSRKTSWSAPHDLTSPAPFMDVYILIQEVLQRSYEQGLNGLEDESCLGLLDSVIAFLRKLPKSAVVTNIMRAQDGFLIVIEDPERVASPIVPRLSADAAAKDRDYWAYQKQAGFTVQKRVSIFWSNILELLRSASHANTSLLASVEPLMTAAFSSPFRDIVNKTSIFWNNSFGAQPSLEYPSGLVPYLRARLVDTELDLPCFPSRSDEEPVVSLPPFGDLEPAASPPPTVSFMGSKVGRNSLFGGKKPLLDPKATHEVQTSSKRISSAQKPISSFGSATKPRMRHDDSQIEFEPILSSPLPTESNDLQLLTDHQKDVLARQQVNAQMFPDLSSSPIVEPAPLSRRLPKKLDFSSNSARAAQAFGTPTGPTEGNPMSDDLPSSPTPRAASRPIMLDEPEEPEVDPPSSPPSRSDEDHASNPDEDVVVAVVSVGKSDDRQDEGFTENNEDKSPDSDLPMQTAPQSTALVVEPGEAEIEVDKIPEKPSGDSPNREQKNLEEAVEEDASQQSQSGKRKRKRSSGVRHSMKKRGKVAQDVDDHPPVAPEMEADDAEDEIIVVARRDPSSITTSYVSDEEQPTVKSPQKRGEKKKKKNQKPELSQDSTVSPAASRALKRRTTARSNSDPSQNVEIATTVDDSPVPPKTRRRSKDHDVKTTKATEDELQPRRRTTRQLSAVLIPVDESQPERAQRDVLDIADGADVDEDSRSDLADSVNPDSQLTQEHSAAVRGRRIAQPHSIIARLRSVLTDCKKMIFGSQEERELDDVLFELRREVHEASRRGRGLAD